MCSVGTVDGNGLALSAAAVPFRLPFALLLSQTLKKNPRTISSIAIFII